MHCQVYTILFIPLIMYAAIKPINYRVILCQDPMLVVLKFFNCTIFNFTVVLYFDSHCAYYKMYALYFDSHCTYYKMYAHLISTTESYLPVDNCRIYFEAAIKSVLLLP